MAGLPIVIDVGLAEPQRELLGVMLGACSRAAADSECYLVSEAPEGPYRAIAMLTWEREDRVRVEVGVRRSAGGEWRTRQLSFQAGDESLERYRSVGFIVGTLARDAPEPAEAPPPEPEPPRAAEVKVDAPRSAPPASRSAPFTAPSRVSGFLMPFALIGGALDRGGPRYGGGVRAGLRPHENWFFSAVIEGSFRPRAQEVTLSWADGGLGAGVRSTSTAPVHFEGRVELLAEIFRAEAQLAGRGEARSRLVGAARAGADVVLDLSPSIGLAAGADATVRFGATTIRVGDEEVGATATIDLGGMIGVRVEL
jgi:hypothetical protein